MRPVIFTKTLASASSNNIAASQSLAGAGNLTINGSAASGGVATLDTQRRVIITSAGNDSALTWTVYGTNGFGNAISESFAGSNGGAAQSNLDYKTVTRIFGSAATASTVTAGTNGVGSSHWVSISPHLPTVEASIACYINSGSVTYTVEYTYQDVNNLPNSRYGIMDQFVPEVWPDTVVNNVTTNQIAITNDPIWATRVTINSGTGTLTAQIIQAGIAGQGR